MRTVFTLLHRHALRTIAASAMGAALLATTLATPALAATSPRQGTDITQQVSPPKGVIVVTPGTKVIWGNTKAGKHFEYVVKPGQSLTASQRAVIDLSFGVCTLGYDGGISLGGGLIADYTVQTCTGDFGIMYTLGQFWRSSYRGWLGYNTEWGESDAVVSSPLLVLWGAVCTSGKGTYNYALGAQGFATVEGYSSKIMSAPGPDWNCGPTRSGPPSSQEII